MSRMFVSSVALLAGNFLWWGDNDVRVVPVNVGSELLAHWNEDEIGCEFYDMTVKFGDDLCSHFTISRSATVHAKAKQRALTCSGEYASPCVLSTEVGFAIPALFWFGTDGSGDLSVVAPRMLPMASEQDHVRLSAPDGSGVFNTKTVVFNQSVDVEYWNGDRQTLEHAVFTGEKAYCVQLLRMAFSQECWAKLD